MLKYKFISFITILFILCFSVNSSAQERTRIIGTQADVGAPDGFAIGLNIKPLTRRAYFNLALTDNGINLGERLGFTIDPFNFPIAPSFTAEIGNNYSGTVPYIHRNNSSLSTNDYYINMHLGLEMGNQNKIRFFIRGGFSYINADINGFSQFAGNNDPTIHINNFNVSSIIMPTGKLGFAFYF